MPSHISHYPVSATRDALYHLIFFITGNPGLVSYYSTFLSTLNSLLQNNQGDLFHVYSQCLAGFDDDVGGEPPKVMADSQSTPYSLEDQIKISLKALQERRIPSGPRRGQSYDGIIIIGHSVGSYMLLEIIQRLKKASSPLKIKAGILLFATITHLAQSPGGLKFASLFRIPDFPRNTSLIVKGILWFAPNAMVKWLVGLIADMPDDAAEVTTRFLKSRMGVWQALHLAQDEMETITEDRWDEDIWGVEHMDSNSKIEAPKLIFYFGADDRWVANNTRDALIAARAESEGESPSSKPIMLIDENGIDHAFSIRHSESVAEKVKVWIDEILEVSKQESRTAWMCESNH